MSSDHRWTPIQFKIYVLLFYFKFLVNTQGDRCKVRELLMYSSLRSYTRVYLFLVKVAQTSHRDQSRLDFPLSPPQNLPLMFLTRLWTSMTPFCRDLLTKFYCSIKIFVYINKFFVNNKHDCSTPKTFLRICVRVGDFLNVKIPVPSPVFYNGLFV